MASKKDPDEAFQGPGFKMLRRGRHLEIQTHRSPEEQRTLMRRMKESRPKILTEIESATSELLVLLHKYSSLDLVANLLFRDGMVKPDKYKESESELRPHWVEHATVLELKDSQYQVRDPVLVDIADLERAHELLDHIFAQTSLYYMAESANPDRIGPPSRLDELRFFALLWGMSVRSPAYSSHWRDVLLGLFEQGRVAEFLASQYTISIRSAFSLIDAIESHITNSIHGRFENARKTRREFLQQLKQYTRTGVFSGETDKKELFDRVRNMRAKQGKRYLTYALVEWTRAALATVLSFNAAQLAEQSAISIEHTQAFLNQVSLAFGVTPSDYVLPAPVNILHERPIIHYDSDYFCSVPHLLPWCIKPAFERLLKGTPAWNSYQKQRSSYLVTTTLQYLSTMLDGAKTYRGLFYKSQTGEKTELDGLVLFDRYAFLLEGKSGSLGAARRGGPEKMKTQLEALVGDAADQVARAHTYIRENDAPIFELETGEKVVVDKTRYSELVVMTVTLDVLDIFTADMYQMREIGVVTSHDLPWCIALTDLRCICEILIRSFEFTHFLRWRFARIADASVSGGKDELNWLGVYLKEGPMPPSTPSGYSYLAFTSYTDDFDAYFLYKEGVRTVRAIRPAQPLPRPMNEICDALIAQASYGFTQIGEQLLDLTFDQRKQFAQKLVQLAFNESKGRVAEFLFETERVVIKMITSTFSKVQLHADAVNLRQLRAKRILILAVTSRPQWLVREWVLVP